MKTFILALTITIGSAISVSASATAHSVKCGGNIYRLRYDNPRTAGYFIKDGVAYYFVGAVGEGAETQYFFQSWDAGPALWNIDTEQLCTINS